MKTRKNRLRGSRVKRLRSYIEDNRCDVRPSLTHDWFRQTGFPADGGVMEWYQCRKCGTEEI